MKNLLKLILLVSVFLSPWLLQGQTMGEFIGVNMRAKDGYPQGFQKFGTLREYHEWASDIGYDSDNIINCPTNVIKLNPALNDPSTLLNFDGFYASQNKRAYPTFKGLAPEMRGLQSYNGLLLEQKPFCKGLDGLEGYGSGSGSFGLTTLSQHAFPPTQNGFYDGIVSAEVTPGDSYSGTVTVQIPSNSDGTPAYPDKEYSLRVWVDFNEDGKFENRIVQFDPNYPTGSDYPILGEGESIYLEGASTQQFVNESGNISTDKLLIFDESDFSNVNNNLTKAVTYDFKIPPTISSGLIKIRIAFTVANPDDYENGIPNFWQLANPGTYGSSDMWDMGLIGCSSSNFVVPSWNESFYGDFNDIFGKIINFKLEQNANTLIDKSISYQDANGEHDNFFDVSSVIYFDKDYALKVEDNMGSSYFGMWVEDKNGSFVSIVPSTLIDGNTIKFNIPSNNSNLPSGLYRARLAVGDATINPNGNFSGELRDFLLVLGSNPECNGLVSLNASTPANISPGAEFEKLSIGLDIAQDSPEAWLDFAKWTSMITAKYGSQDLYSNSTGDVKDAFDQMFSATELTKDPNGKADFGLDLIDHVEIGNEMDKFWRGDKSLLNTGNNLYQMIPNQFAAYLSANYDGACKDPMFKIDDDGHFYGVKNMDNSIDVAMGGLAGMQGGFLEGVIDWVVANRSSCGRKLPFDIVNLHHYCTTLNKIDDMSGKVDGNGNALTNYEATYQLWDWNGFGDGHGVSPEEGGLRAYTERVLQDLMAHAKTKGVLKEFADCDVWVSEFGYDSSQGDLDAETTTSWVAVPTVGDNSLQETQAQWDVRSFLELSAVNAVYDGHVMHVNRAMIFDYRDDGIHPLDPTYNDSGLLRDNEVHNSEPKKAWYHVQTMRNVLGQTTYQGEITGKTMTPLNGTSFDFSPKARIYHYRGDYKGTERDILVIWSPNSSDSQGELTLDFKSSDFSNLLETGFESLTLITPQDGDEDGLHQAVSTTKTDITNTYTFTGDHAITETPMYVVLNVAEENDKPHNCPNFVIEDKGCSSFTLRWDPMIDEPKKVDIYVVNAADAAFDDSGNVALQIENDAYKLQARDYKYDIRKHGIGHLEAGQSYYVVFVMKWADGSIKVCSKKEPIIMSVEDGLCQIPYWDGAGSEPTGLHFTGKVASSYDDGLDALNYLTAGPNSPQVSCMDYEEGVVPDCDGVDSDENGIDDCHEASYDPVKGKYINDEDQDGILNGHDADDDGIVGTDQESIDDNNNGIDDRYEYENNKIWNFAYGAVTPQIIVTFSEPIILNSLSFLHVTGNGYITVEYELCGCPASEEFGTPSPDKGWYHAATIAPNGYMNWVYLSEGFPANYAISRIRLTKNQSSTDNLSLARLSFCGQPKGCRAVHVPGPAEPGKGFRSVNIKSSSSGTTGRVSIDPIDNLLGDPSGGYKRAYHILYQEDNEAELDFTSSKYQRAVLLDGSDKVKTVLKDLTPDTKYKMYLYVKNPCGWSWGTRYPVIPNSNNPVIPLVGVLDTIIYFNTYEEGVMENKIVGASSTISTHFVTANPNPTTGWTTFNWDLTGYNQLLIISGYSGEIIASYEVDPMSVSHQVDLTGIGNGPYFIRLEGDQLIPLNGQLVKATE